MITSRGRVVPDFRELAGPVCSRGRVQEMRHFPQHGCVSTYDHVVRVSRTALRWSRALPIRVHEHELVRGALLHDYYLYDWHDPQNVGHATRHPLRALRNAEEDFGLTERERNIIASHMWPLPPTRIPRCVEAWVVCAADKWCSLVETVLMR
ncbi:MAG: phosphohydrolase [Atopobiaceae bacterium]|nr:phosphohydrolase [Atopobiaceae bacterium]